MWFAALVSHSANVVLFRVVSVRRPNKAKAVGKKASSGAQQSLNAVVRVFPPRYLSGTSRMALAW